MFKKIEVKKWQVKCRECCQAIFLPPCCIFDTQLTCPAYFRVYRKGRGVRTRWRCWTRRWSRSSRSWVCQTDECSRIAWRCTCGTYSTVWRSRCSNMNTSTLYLHLYHYQILNTSLVLLEIGRLWNLISLGLMHKKVFLD